MIGKEKKMERWEEGKNVPQVFSFYALRELNIVKNEGSDPGKIQR